MNNLQALLAPFKERVQKANPLGTEWEALTDPGDRKMAPAWIVDADDIEIRLPATYAAGKVADLIANAPTDLTRLVAAVEEVLGISEIKMTSEHGDPAFVQGWECAIEEMHARVAAALGSDTNQEGTQ